MIPTSPSFLTSDADTKKSLLNGDILDLKETKEDYPSPTLKNSDSETNN